MADVQLDFVASAPHAAVLASDFDCRAISCTRGVCLSCTSAALKSSPCSASLRRQPPLPALTHSLLIHPRAATVRLIGESREMVGVVTKEEALSLAQAAGVDLVCISPDADPPVCRLVEYSKFRYDQARRLISREERQASVALSAEEDVRWTGNLLRRNSASHLFTQRDISAAVRLHRLSRGPHSLSPHPARTRPRRRRRPPRRRRRWRPQSRR